MELQTGMDQILLEKVHGVLQTAQKHIVGQEALLEAMMAALICEGHLLIEGLPGLGKTLSVSVMSKLCDLSFKRIQFTPDLLPSDLIGTMVFSQKNEDFKTKFGPIFTQILLADEINRAPAKVQSALLESMAERQVTIGDTSYDLNTPFVVMATQNPIEQEGTYPLPEAQLDRFMMKIKVEYPSFAAEKSILDLKSSDRDQLTALLTADDFLALKEKIEAVHVDDKIKDFIVRLVQSTRPESENFAAEFQGMILAGASPRAGLWLYKLARFKAFMNGQNFVTPDHVLSLVPQVLGHRIHLSYEASVDHLRAQDLVVKMAKKLI